MKAQLSLELLLYISLAGLSTAVVLGPVAKDAANIGTGISMFEVSQAVTAMNSALLAEGGERLQVFIPSSMCASTVSGTMLNTGGRIFYFVKPVRVAELAFCPGGAVVQLQITSNDAGGLVERA